MKSVKTGAARSLSIFFILLLLVSSAHAQAAAPATQKNFLWKVKSKTATVYLLGSIHYYKKELYPLSKNIEDAFGKSDVLAVEANVNDISRLDISRLMESAFYPDGDSLEKHLSRANYGMVMKKLGDAGMPPELVKRQRPWFLALTLTSLELLKSGLDPSYGIDMHFLSRAEGTKRITELESLDYQLGLFTGFSDREQEMFLLYTLKDLDAPDTEAGRLLEIWRSGDARAMESLILKSFKEDNKISSLYEKLIYDRNIRMGAKIEGYLRTHDTYFVVVGAGHLVGKNGIVELLRAKGYPIEQL